jgi:hypothetical protein
MESQRHAWHDARPSASETLSLYVGCDRAGSQNPMKNYFFNHVESQTSRNTEGDWWIRVGSGLLSYTHFIKNSPSTMSDWEELGWVRPENPTGPRGVTTHPTPHESSSHFPPTPLVSDVQLLRPQLRSLHRLPPPRSPLSRRRRARSPSRRRVVVEGSRACGVLAMRWRQGRSGSAAEARWRACAARWTSVEEVPLAGNGLSRQRRQRSPSRTSQGSDCFFYFVFRGLIVFSFCI